MAVHEEEDGIYMSKSSLGCHSLDDELIYHTASSYHHYTAENFELGINKLDFSTGWPVVV